MSALLIGAALAPAGSTAARAAPGWVIKIASPRATTPDWAYPFASAGELTSSNVAEFQQLMYRPLFFFGASASIALDGPRSLATAPTYSANDQVVSFTVRPGLRWSDGEAVTADGVVEWLNLLAAFPGMWGDYLAPAPGGQPLGIPDDIREVAVTGRTVTLTLAGPVNPTWFTDSELSQITPLPASWDVFEPAHPRVPTSGPLSIAGNHGEFTAATQAAGCYGTHWIGDGNHGPASAFTDPLGTRTVVTAADLAQAQRCVDVVLLMRSMATDRADYTASGTDVAAVFGAADGPWRLAAYNAATGSIAMAPNRASGASGQRPTASQLRLVPCGTPAACEGLLARGRVDQGVLPLADAPGVASLAAAPSRNPLRTVGYRETVVAPWSTSYLPYDFRSTRGAGGHAGRVFAQRYLRLAIQSLVDQAGMIRRDLHGYGVATDAPVPAVPPTTFASPVQNPAPFSIAHAAALLEAHGWHRARGHPMVCVAPSRCGAGIPRGTPLSFTLEYATSPTADAMMTRFSRDAARAGVVLRLEAVPAVRVIADVAGASGAWDLASWGSGWAYAPGYFPSGEWVFAQGSPWNVGTYVDAQATSLVLATTRSPTALAAYDQFIATALPVIWQPTPVTIVETRASIRGVIVSPLGTITPEAWRR